MVVRMFHSYGAAVCMYDSIQQLESSLAVGGSTTQARVWRMAKSKLILNSAAPISTAKHRTAEPSQAQLSSAQLSSAHG